jgi:hypothetical protein
MSFLSRWFPWTARSKPSREALLNDGLELAMDWGENWLAPIQGRLHKIHPRLQISELDEIDAACRQAMNFGHETLYELRIRQGKDVSTEEFTASLLAQFPWVSPANAARLFNQSTYYAWKAGGPAREL